MLNRHCEVVSWPASGTLVGKGRFGPKLVEVLVCVPVCARTDDNVMSCTATGRNAKILAGHMETPGVMGPPSNNSAFQGPRDQVGFLRRTPGELSALL